MASSSQETQIFVLGLLSIVLCPILGPIAWSQGNNYMNDCLFDDRSPDGLAIAGRIMGIIGSVQLVLVGLAFLFPCCLALLEA